MVRNMSTYCSACSLVLAGHEEKLLNGFYRVSRTILDHNTRDLSVIRFCDDFSKPDVLNSMRSFKLPSNVMFDALAILQA